MSVYNVGRMGDKLECRGSINRGDGHFTNHPEHFSELSNNSPSRRRELLPECNYFAPDPQPHHGPHALPIREFVGAFSEENVDWCVEEHVAKKVAIKKSPKKATDDMIAREDWLY